MFTITDNSNKTLKFMKTYTRTTDSDGKFSIPINLKKGDYVVTVNYGGGILYSPSNRTVNLHVK